MFLGLTCNDLHGDDALKGTLPRCDRNYDCPTTAGSDKKTVFPMDGEKRTKRSPGVQWESPKPWVPYMGPLDDRDTSKMDNIKLRYHYMTPNPPQEIPDTKLRSWPSPCIRHDGLQDPEKERKCLEQEARQGYWRPKKERRPLLYHCHALPPLCVCGYIDGTKKMVPASQKPKAECPRRCGGALPRDPQCQPPFPYTKRVQDGGTSDRHLTPIFNIVPNAIRQEGMPKAECPRRCGGALPRDPQCQTPRPYTQRVQDGGNSERHLTPIFNIVPNAIRQEGYENRTQRALELAKEAMCRRTGGRIFPPKCPTCCKMSTKCCCKVPKCPSCCKLPSKCSCKPQECSNCCKLPLTSSKTKCPSCCSLIKKKVVCFKDPCSPPSEPLCKVICKEKIYCPPDTAPECKERQIFEKTEIKERRICDPVFAPQPPYKPIYIPVCKPIYVPIYKPACKPVCKIVCDPMCEPVCQPVCKRVCKPASNPCGLTCNSCPPVCNPSKPMSYPCAPVYNPYAPMCNSCGPVCEPVCKPDFDPCSLMCASGFKLKYGQFGPYCEPICKPVCNPFESVCESMCKPTCQPVWTPAGRVSCPIPCASVTLDGRPGDLCCAPQNLVSCSY